MNRKQIRDMKNCPNCNSEIEDNFELCWNCNYSCTENRVIEIKDMALQHGNRAVDCLRCEIPLVFSGKFNFHEGARFGVLGNIFELFVNKEAFDLYVCPKCGKVEFFVPLSGSSRP